MTLGICNELWVEHLPEQLTLSHCSERFLLVPAMCKGEVGIVSNGFELLNKEDSGDLAYWWLCGCPWEGRKAEGIYSLFAAQKEIFPPLALRLKLTV